MKKFLILIFILISVIAFSTTLPQLFESAMASNTNLSLANLKLEQASMTYQMNMIQASIPVVNQGEQIAAQIAYISSLQSYQSSLKNYYFNIISATFKVEISKTNLEISQMKLEVATSNYANILALFGKSLISKISLQQASVTVAEDKNNFKNAQWNYKFAILNFQDVTGKKWKGITISVPNFSSIPASLTKWLNDDLSVKSARLALESAKHSLQIIPKNSSQYTIKTAKIAVQRAKLNLKNAILSSKNDYFSLMQKLRYDYNHLLDTKTSLEIAEKNLHFFTQAYRSNLISKVVYLNQYELPYLKAKNAYYGALEIYWDDLVSYTVANDLNPGDVLK